MFTGILLLLQKQRSGLMALLTSPAGVEFFWHLVIKPKGERVRGLFSTVGEDNEEGRRRRGADSFGQVAEAFRRGGAGSSYEEETGAGEPVVTDFDEGIKLETEDLRHGRRNLRFDDESGTPGVGATTGTTDGAGVVVHAATQNKQKTSSGRAEERKTTDVQDLPVPGGEVKVDEAGSEADPAGGGVLTAKRLKLPDQQFLEALGLKTLVQGLTILKNDWVELFDGPLFMSFQKFLNPDVNLHLSYTTLLLYSSLLRTHPHLLVFDPLFPRVGFSF